MLCVAQLEVTACKNCDATGLQSFYSLKYTSVLPPFIPTT